MEGGAGEERDRGGWRACSVLSLHHIREPVRAPSTQHMCVCVCVCVLECITLD